MQWQSGQKTKARAKDKMVSMPVCLGLQLSIIFSGTHPCSGVRTDSSWFGSEKSLANTLSNVSLCSLFRD